MPQTDPEASGCEIRAGRDGTDYHPTPSPGTPFVTPAPKPSRGGARAHASAVPQRSELLHFPPQPARTASAPYNPRVTVLPLTKTGKRNYAGSQVAERLHLTWLQHKELKHPALEFWISHGKSGPSKPKLLSSQHVAASGAYY